MVILNDSFYSLGKKICKANAEMQQWVRTGLELFCNNNNDFILYIFRRKCYFQRQNVRIYQEIEEGAISISLYLGIDSLPVRFIHLCFER